MLNSIAISSILVLLMINASITYTITEVYIYVLEDGYSIIKYYINVERIPRTIEVQIMGSPIIISAICGGDYVPTELLDHKVRITVTNNSCFLIYVTSELTSKSGYIWRFNVDTIAKTVIYLPKDSIVINVTPSSFKLVITNESIGFIFNSNESVIIDYIIIPEELRNITRTTSTKGTTSQLHLFITPLIIVSVIVIITTILLYLVMRRKYSALSRTVSISRSELDERDLLIINALRSRGELSAHEIMNITRIPKTPLYRRLRKLEDLGIIESRVVQGKTLYRLKKIP